MPVTLVVGENTYVTLEEANSYLGTAMSSSEWLCMAEEKKKKLLVFATELLDENFSPFKGQALSDTQSLGFPRTAFRFTDPVLCLSVPVVSGEFPVLLKKSVMLIAQHLAENEATLFGDDSDKDWTRVELGPFTIERQELDSPSSVDLAREQFIPRRVYKLMRPLMMRGNNHWFRGW